MSVRLGLHSASMRSVLVWYVCSFSNQPLSHMLTPVASCWWGVCRHACSVGSAPLNLACSFTPFTDGDADVFEGCCSCPARLVVCVCCCCREQEDREERERLRKEGKPLPPELLREGGLVATAAAAACFFCGCGAHASTLQPTS